MIVSLNIRGLRRAMVGGTIIAAHFALALALFEVPSAARELEGQPEQMLMQFFEPESSALLSLNLELAPAEPSVILPMPRLFPDSPETGTSLQLPAIDPELQLDAAAYSAQAMLSTGETASISLLLEIGSDGLVISAKIVRSNARDAANEAALDYALATRWSPGRIDGEPSVMQASLTVILGEQG